MVLSKKVMISIIIISLFVTSSYLFEYISKERGLNSARIIKVSVNSRLVALMETGTLMQLESKESGPALLSVIAAAGVDDFNIIEVKGQSVYQIKKDEINRDYFFCFTDHGTVNLSKKNDDRFLVEDVKEINAAR